VDFVVASSSERRKCNLSTVEVSTENRSPLTNHATCIGMSERIPHKQLKAIRRKLGLTQMAAAAKLNVSYPYLLAVETGQRDLSARLARNITKAFGVERIEQKNQEPMIRNSDGKLVPFTKDEYRRYVSSRPSFWVDSDFAGPQGRHKITPTLEDYARCAHALLVAAEKERTLRPVVADFFRWFAQSISTDSIYERLKAIFKEIFPETKSDAFLALTIYWGRQVENKIVTEQERKEKAAARALEKRKRKPTP
ncbi:MAG: helix-turn-helix transcriptional regulator, partial [Chthoniobacterales bacterium]